MQRPRQRGTGEREEDPLDNLPPGVSWNEGWGELPAKQDVLKRAVDEVGWKTFGVLGTNKMVPFFLHFKKVKRLQHHWTVVPVDDDVSPPFRTIPCYSKDVTIVGLFDANGLRITPRKAFRENGSPSGHPKPTTAKSQTPTVKEPVRQKADEKTLLCFLRRS